MLVYLCLLSVSVLRLSSGFYRAGGRHPHKPLTSVSSRIQKGHGATYHWGHFIVQTESVKHVDIASY